jgi:predicted transcriptional regulator
MAILKKGTRITGASRSKLADDLKKRYDKGASIRELADSSGRSYGFIHRVLAESGVTLRGRGGATRSKVAMGAKVAAAAKVATASKAPTRKAAGRPAKGK